MVQDIADRCTGGLTKTAIGKLVKIIAQVHQVIQIFQRASSFRNVGQDFKSTLIADAAGIAFSAAFFAEEIQQVLWPDRPHRCLHRKSTRAPEPSATPALLKESKSMGVSCRLAGMMEPEEPPVWASLKVLPFFHSLAVNGDDFTQGNSHRNFDQTGDIHIAENGVNLGAGLVGGPKLRYQSAPFRRIGATFASVSTLLTRVGLSHKPLVVG